jgi:transposase-like protein
MSRNARTHAQKLVQVTTGRDIVELLRTLYVDERRTDREIGAALGVDRATIQEWRKSFGITRDERGELAPLVTA